MQLARSACASQGTIRRWQYRADWRVSLTGLLAALAALMLAARGHWVDGGVSLATVLIAATSTTWRRLPPNDGDATRG
jgi:hypothetical protein